jgi:hypothetical protein
MYVCEWYQPPAGSHPRVHAYTTPVDGCSVAPLLFIQ